MGQHALLSPSAAHRWLRCTASPRLEEGMEDKSSVFAEEGTLAHAYCAKKLKTSIGLPTDDEDTEIAELSGKYHTGEMDEYTDTYHSIVMAKLAEARKRTSDAMLLVEVRLDFSRWVPEAFGTADAVIIADGTMEIVDFKYGKGVKVSAEGNPQMMIYAIGAYEEFSLEYDIRDIRMTIVQPRIDNLSEATISVTELMRWANDTLLPRAEEAYKGGGKREPGEWCQFCKVKSRCEALATYCVDTVSKGETPGLLTKEEMERSILPRLATIKTWLSGVEEYALSQALSGVRYDGFKVVEGRSVRRITDEAAVIELLTGNGYDRQSVVKPEEIRSLTELERLVGKKTFTSLCGDYIEKPKGKPTLVPNSDKRPEINTAEDDFKDID